LSSELVEKDF
jgi:uncharacterized coiled-coil protein SlyX